MRYLLATILMTAVGHAFGQAPDVLSLCDFETWTWEGLQRSTEQVKQGEHSGKWADLKERPSVRPARIPNDWSHYDRLTFWMYSEKANGQRLTLVCNSENKADKEGWDYFYLHFRADWVGWKFFNLRLGEDIRPTRKPLGWQQIDYLMISASGWQNHPLPDTVLYFDDFRLVRDPVRLRVEQRRVVEGDADTGLRRVTYILEIENRSAEQRGFDLASEARGEEGKPRAYKLSWLPQRTPEIAPDATALLTVELTATKKDLQDAEPLTREEFVVQVKSDSADVPGPQVTLSAAVPLPKREHPLLFASAETIANTRARAEKYPWAKKQLEGIIGGADSAVKMEVKIPDEAGQWGHHYVCKKCGAGLKQQDGKHVCKKCGAVYTGWPYDQVVIAGVHHRYWSAVRTLGLGYAFAGNEAYAQKAREILLAYADKYLTYPIHNVRGKVSRSGARVFAQTLDESVAIIGVAWGYDLIYDSPCLSAEDRAKIEQDFLRQVVETIKRNDAGISNWQSWHNAGMTAVGLCLQDEEIASLAINGKSGLRFQLRNSILKDGFWYEGTAAYHYYALDALRYTTEAAYFAGIDFYGDPAYKSLYDAPILYTFPDLTFPAVNDSDVFSITGRHSLYDLAYARFGDPKHLMVATLGRRNSLEAFLWGVDELPPAPEVALESKDFKGLGAAVLRQGEGAEQLYVHLDYGPHGGGHGHPDKLTLILFGLGRQLAPDPARLAYGAPLQGSWYRQTFAHNTVCVDGRSQRATEGKLTVFHSQPGLALAQAECDTAYPGVTMRRTVALTDSYVIDIFTVAGEEGHTYDWLWHNFGELAPGLETTARETPLGDGHGYQHITGVTEASTDESWYAAFEQENANVRLTMLETPGTQLYFGMGMANKPPQPCPMVVARREAKATAFISVIEPYRERPAVVGVRTTPVSGEGAIALEIAREGGRDLLMLAQRGGVEREFAGIKTTARACFVRMDGDRPAEVHHVE